MRQNSRGNREWVWMPYYSVWREAGSRERLSDRGRGWWKNGTEQREASTHDTAHNGSPSRTAANSCSPRLHVYLNTHSSSSIFTQNICFSTVHWNIHGKISWLGWKKYIYFCNFYFKLFNKNPENSSIVIIGSSGFLLSGYGCVCWRYTYSPNE